MARTKSRVGLPFERPILEQLDELERLRTSHDEGDVDLAAEVAAAEGRLQALTREIFERLSPWERVQLARHVDRPQVADYVDSVFTDVVELHGDRGFADDPAILTAVARIGGRPVLLVGHRKGRDIDERKSCNFGMPNPEGYRKAILKMRLAERFGLPIVCLVDTPGAYPGIGAEERGQAWAIAENIEAMSALRTPIVVAVIGEGGSGGALGIGVGDRVLMMENAYYSVITPEGCAAILWKSPDKAPEAAAQLRLTAADLLRLGIVDEVVSEPMGGAHRNPAHAAGALKQALERALSDVVGTPIDALLELRYRKYRTIGGHLFADPEDSLAAAVAPPPHAGDASPDPA